MANTITIAPQPLVPFQSQQLDEAVAAVPASGSAPAAERTALPRPQWQIPNAGSGTNYEMLGLPMPRSNGDLAALLAQVSLSLERTTDEARKSEAIARLAGLAAQLTQFDLAPLGATVDRTTATRQRAEATEASLRAATDPLIAQRGGATSDAARAEIDLQIMAARIASLDARAADLRADLAAAPTVADKASIQAKLDDVIAARTTLAETRTGFADTFSAIERNQALLDAERAKPEKERNGTLIASLSSWLSTARENLPSVYSQLAAQGVPAVAADLTTLAGNTSSSRTLEQAARTALNTASTIAVAVARAAAAAYAATSTSENNQAAERDIGIDRTFVDIADTSKQIAARLSAVDEARASNIEENEKAGEQRLAALAAALVSALANIASVLASTGSLASGDAASAPPSRARTRIDA
ncbi:hypothetical protein [Antarcticirhabdus aurantiaca]|uniref:Uncharacterized protein n=1 Tax=Antarcticirhabdus aurantiaca TaxID=2606717 RepID=A0ACD4NUX9_9HYPH|nr:hypothetical protein [Antarcticirhabdus aurantiaca]WAJ30500.1 hypothetical protein OXU80_09975 [Jeongeuplla avenae]